MTKGGVRNLCRAISVLCARRGVLWDCGGKRRAIPLCYRSISSSREKRRRCFAIPRRTPKKDFAWSIFRNVV